MILKNLSLTICSGRATFIWYSSLKEKDVNNLRCQPEACCPPLVYSSEGAEHYAPAGLLIISRSLPLVAPGVIQIKPFSWLSCQDLSDPFLIELVSCKK